MRVDWVPASAALLVTGAMALALASVVAVQGGEGADLVALAEDNSGRWLAAAGIFFLASVTLMMGLPSILTLLEERGRILAGLGAVFLTVAFIGVAGYAALLIFFRALVLTPGIEIPAGTLDELVEERGLAVFLAGWVGAFYLGELLLALALLRAGPAAAPRWIPVAMLIHVATLVLNMLLPDSLARASVLVFAVAFSALGIRAATGSGRRP